MLLAPCLQDAMEHQVVSLAPCSRHLAHRPGDGYWPLRQCTLLATFQPIGDGRGRHNRAGGSFRQRRAWPTSEVVANNAPAVVACGTWWLQRFFPLLLPPEGFRRRAFYRSIASCAGLLALTPASHAYMHANTIEIANEHHVPTRLGLQVASVSVLLGSSIIALIKHEPFITPTHALAYLLMFVGGILPACAGQLSLLLSRTFWRQTFVAYAISAELALGLHDLMLSGTAYNAPSSSQAGAPQQQQQQAGPPGALESAGVPGAVTSGGGGLDEPAESFEFFVWSRCSFIVTFVLVYTCSPSLNAELRDLLSGRINKKYIALSGLSEGLTIVGFYLASIAYGLFYQAGIVHAAEASLSQLFNLMLAYLLLRGFGIGRSSAVSSMSIKLASFVMVTIGLFLCTLEAERPPSRIVEAARRSDLHQLPGTSLSGYAGVYTGDSSVVGSYTSGSGNAPGESSQVSTHAVAVAAQAARRMLRRRRRL